MKRALVVLSVVAVLALSACAPIALGAAAEARGLWLHMRPAPAVDSRKDIVITSKLHGTVVYRLICDVRGQDELLQRAPYNATFPDKLFRAHRASCQKGTVQ